MQTPPTEFPTTRAVIDQLKPMFPEGFILRVTYANGGERNIIPFILCRIRPQGTQ